MVPGGGQARIEGADGSFDAITIALADPLLGFGKLQFNLDADDRRNRQLPRVDQFGNVFNFNLVDLGRTGQNFFTLYSLDNQVAVEFFAPFHSSNPEHRAICEQVRLGPRISLRQVAEPGSLALLGVGLLGLAGMTRRRNAGR